MFKYVWLFQSNTVVVPDWPYQYTAIVSHIANSTSFQAYNAPSWVQVLLFLGSAIIEEFFLILIEIKLLFLCVSIAVTKYVQASVAVNNQVDVSYSHKESIVSTLNVISVSVNVQKLRDVSLYADTCVHPPHQAGAALVHIVQLEVIIFQTAQGVISLGTDMLPVQSKETQLIVLAVCKAVAVQAFQVISSHS